jgi:hypothetical protein
MTKLEFIALCGEHGIEPAIALESDAIVEALQSRDDQKVVKLLTEEF